MKKKIIFFINCIIVTVLLLILCFGVLMPQYSNDYQAALIDKEKRLRETEGERIVLIGDSNLAFGIDSEMIEEAFGRPVVNMGLHGGTGDVFNERAALLHVHSGDLYVFCPSRYGDGERPDRLDNPLLVWITLEDNLRLYPMIRAKDWPDMVCAFPTYIRRCSQLFRTGEGNGELPGCYRRSAFNEYGDNYFPRPGPEEGVDFTPVAVSDVSGNVTKRLDKIYDELAGRGADMVIAAYPVPLCENVPSETEYDKMAKELDENTKAKFISDFSDYRYDTSFFFDTYLHLTDEGVRARTTQLINDIDKYLKER